MVYGKVQPIETLESVEQMKLQVLILKGHFFRLPEYQRKWNLSLTLAIQTVYEDWIDSPKRKEMS